MLQLYHGIPLTQQTDLRRVLVRIYSHVSASKSRNCASIESFAIAGEDILRRDGYCTGVTSVL